MSSFAGRMKEYQTISIDRFDRENLHARAYFLSHCHKDHMKGLKGPFLKRKLERSLTVKLYCSFVTRELLLSNPKYGFWEGHIEALEIDSPTHIPLIDEVTGESDHVVVTLLPAGHCPGSVMFLFEGAQGTVLYTGDFRLAIGDASRMEYLHSGDRVKDILSVYLDSTFYEPRYYQIPSRETCLNGIRNLVQDWICQSPYHVVWFNCKAAYGYEYLFTNLGQEFNSQIHVNSLDMFLKMPEILCHMTTDRETQIHACRHPRDDEMFRANRLPCGSTARDGTPLRIISIKPSTIWFGERTRKTNVIVRVGASSFRACFSFHSSYSEINDFLSYIRPVNIYPSVIPIGCSLEDATELLKPMCRKPSLGAEMVYKPLGMLKRTRKEPILHDSDSDEELFGEVAVVPKRRKLPFKEIVAEPQDQKKTPVIQGTVDVLPEPRPSVHASNYFDCTESNDDDDDDDEEEESKQLPKPKPEDTLSSGDAPSALPVSQTATCCRKPISPSSHVAPPHADPAPPCWNSFFTAEPVLTDESCELDSSQRSQSQSQALSTDHTCSQSPELFRDEDEDEDDDDDDGDGDGDDNGTCGHDDDGYIIISSSQSTNISDTVGESCSQSDTVIIMEEERNNVQPSSQSSTKANGELVGGALNDSSNSQSEPPEGAEHISDSQVSSDFELPSTPGSETPSPQELNELYRKLAAGQEVVVRRGQQRRV